MAERLRALTVQQPWAWAIVHGGKTVENRGQSWRYRGPLAVHAGMRWSQRGADFEPLQRAYATWLGFDHWNGQYGGHTAMPIDPAQDERDQELIDFAAIIGVVDLVDAHPAAGCCAPWGEQEYAGRPVHHLVLENPRPLDVPIPCRGRLGLWPVPDGIALKLPRPPGRRLPRNAPEYMPTVDVHLPEEPSQ